MENIQGSLFGKTSPEHSVQTRDKISARFSKQSAPLKNQKYLYLNLQTGSGLMREKSWETVTLSPGAQSMRNTSESLKDVAESTLSQILEANVQEKYYLSPKACQGILRRAAIRGKELPEVLKLALERQASMGTTEA